MTLYRWLILGCWICFVAYWAAAARGAKPATREAGRWRQAGLRLALAALILLVLSMPAVRRTLRPAMGGGTLAGVIGVALCAVGFGLAVWARRHLGRNWGMPMSRKQHPELITSGPYARIRHPIYAGMLLAMLGSAVAISMIWLLALLVFTGYFLHAASREERLMLAQFPEQYAAYRRRTRMLLPLLL